MIKIIAPTFYIKFTLSKNVKISKKNSRTQLKMASIRGVTFLIKFTRLLLNSHWSNSLVTGLYWSLLDYLFFHSLYISNQITYLFNYGKLWANWIFPASKMSIINTSAPINKSIWFGVLNRGSANTLLFGIDN